MRGGVGEERGKFMGSEEAEGKVKRGGKVGGEGAGSPAGGRVLEASGSLVRGAALHLLFLGLPGSLRLGAPLLRPLAPPAPSSGGLCTPGPLARDLSLREPVGMAEHPLQWPPPEEGSSCPVTRVGVLQPGKTGVQPWRTRPDSSHSGPPRAVALRAGCRGF